MSITGFRSRRKAIVVTPSVTVPTQAWTPGAIVEPQPQVLSGSGVWRDAWLTADDRRCHR